MNALAIILGIVIIILFFVLYTYYTNTATQLTSSNLINLNVDQKSNAITKISSPTNNQFSYGIWIYVNSWAANKSKIIFLHDGVLAVALDENLPILSVYVASNSNDYTKIQITDNFPLQKWVFIIVSMDTSFLDVYLDGKLIKSSKITNLLQPPKDPNIVLGNPEQPFTSFDAYVTCFYRWTVPMDPGTAWNYYMKGNGQNGLLGSLKPYGVKMQVLQNNVETASYNLM